MDIQVLDFEKICRTCLGMDKRMKHLFPMENEDSREMDEIKKMLAECTVYPVLKGEHFPNKICSKCISTVRIVYDFKTQCERAYEMISSVIETYRLEQKTEGVVLPAELVLVNDSTVKKEDTFITNSDKAEDFNPINTEFSTVVSILNPVENEQVAEHACSSCPKIFAQEVNLRKHRTTAHSNGEYFCSVCNKNCGNQTKLNKHYSLCHSGEELNEENEAKTFSKCAECLEDLVSAEATEQHICKQDNSFDPTNVEAILGLNDAKEDMQGLAADNDDPSYEYADGQEDENDDESGDEDKIPLSELLKPKTRKKKKKMKTDQLQNENKEPVKKEHRCDICNKAFSRSTHLKRHKFTHSEEKPFVCKECNKGFTRADHLRLHKFNHSTVKPFVCSECNRGFIRAEHLRRHQETRHGDKEANPNPKTEFCSKCGKGFTTAKYLAIHMRIHTDRKWYCKFCPEVFDSKSKSTEHSKSHAHEKPFLCSECGLRFVRNDYLIIHMRRHKGEKPYKCKYCNKGFPRATDLNVHERYHTGEKTHLCTVCGKGFQRAYNLLVHMRVHTGERPYKCPHCTKSFAQGNDLKSHIRRHTGERFKCEICEEGFIQGYHLTQHKRTIHGINAQSHIRRVAKFVTPSEQQQQMEAIRQQQTEKDDLQMPNESMDMHDSSGEYFKPEVKLEDEISIRAEEFAESP